MPILIILGICTVYAVYGVYNKLTTSNTVHDKETRDKIGREMTGKSPSECRKILKKYR